MLTINSTLMFVHGLLSLAMSAVLGQYYIKNNGMAIYSQLSIAPPPQKKKKNKNKKKTLNWLLPVNSQ